MGKMVGDIQFASAHKLNYRVKRRIDSVKTFKSARIFYSFA